MDPDFSPIGRSVGRAHKFLRAWGDRLARPARRLGHRLHPPVSIMGGRYRRRAPARSKIARFSDMGGSRPRLRLPRPQEPGTATSSGAAATTTPPAAASSGSTLTDTVAGPRLEVDRRGDPAAATRRCGRSARATTKQAVLQVAVDKVSSSSPSRPARRHPAPHLREPPGARHDHHHVPREPPLAGAAATDDQPVIRTVGLTKVYPGGSAQAIVLRPGGRPRRDFGLLGPNGAGKTTTAGMLDPGDPDRRSGRSSAGWTSGPPGPGQVASSVSCLRPTPSIVAERVGEPLLPRSVLRDG